VTTNIFIIFYLY